MQAQSKQSHRDTGHKNSTGASPLLEVRKTIQAPAERVFDAWTKPELIEEWWGPSSYTCPKAKLKLKVGGKYLFCMLSAEGKELWTTGEFIEIDRPRKLVMSDYPSNAEGKIISPEEAGMKGPFAEDGASYITVEIETRGDGESELILSHEGLPAAMHAECVDGWKTSLEKLKNVVERQ